MSAVSWLVWAALHIGDHTGGLVLLQSVLPKSEPKPVAGVTHVLVDWVQPYRHCGGLV